MSGPDRNTIRPLARDDGDPAFEEPWQAHVLAVAFALAERGVFAPSEWSETLGAELRRRAQRGEPDSRYTYYDAALAALETLVSRTGLIAEDGINARMEQWRRAYLNTPHGEPVELESDLL